MSEKRNPIPDEYCSDHLFLLMGTNPLPNYVAARLLLREGGQVYLVHSGVKGTLDAAKRLWRLLKKDGLDDRQVNLLEVDEADAGNIYDGVHGCAKRTTGGGLGLNYTGGTKVMAVQAHRAIRDAAKLGGREPQCSYLDARSHELRFDPVGMKSPPGWRVLQDVEIGLSDLMSLHDIVLGRENANQPARLADSAVTLATVHSDRIGAQAWREWCDKELKEENKCWAYLQQEGKLATIRLRWPTDMCLRSVVDDICEGLGIERKDTVDLADDGIGKTFGKIRRFCEWLDGKWLEQYVIDQVRQVAKDCGLHDATANVETSNFEFDVVAIRGYQLFGISCSTTANKSLAKSKLFEAFIRARQLGGDEARVGLVCGYGYPRALELELAQEWDVPGKLRVFGPGEYLGLGVNLVDWFTERDL